MEKQFNIRYGSNFKVVLAIVLPCLSIAPFILLMQRFQPLGEWELLFIIFAFLACLISFSVWLALRVYPAAILSIYRDEIRLKFDSSNFLSPGDFSFMVKDITSFTRREIRGEEYFVIKTRNPDRKFQVSVSSYKADDYLSFTEAMAEISEKLNVD